MSDVRPLNVVIVSEARSGWDRLERQSGCTATSLVEALGLKLSSLTEDEFNHLVTDDPYGFITEARRIQHEKRKRRRPLPE